MNSFTAKFLVSALIATMALSACGTREYEPETTSKTSPKTPSPDEPQNPSADGGSTGSEQDGRSGTGPGKLSAPSNIFNYLWVPGGIGGAGLGVFGAYRFWQYLKDTRARKNDAQAKTAQSEQMEVRQEPKAITPPLEASLRQLKEAGITQSETGAVFLAPVTLTNNYYAGEKSNKAKAADHGDGHEKKGSKSFKVIKGVVIGAGLVTIASLCGQIIYSIYEAGAASPTQQVQTTTAP